MHSLHYFTLYAIENFLWEYFIINSWKELQNNWFDVTEKVQDVLCILQTLSTQSKSLPGFLTLGISMFLRSLDMKPFIPVTAQELVFGYDDPLISLAHRFFPKTRRPMSQMGLLLGVSYSLILHISTQLHLLIFSILLNLKVLFYFIF